MFLLHYQLTMPFIASPFKKNNGSLHPIFLAQSRLTAY